MRVRHWLRTAAAAVIAAACLSGLLAAQASAYQWSTYQADYAGEELMRLTNLDRTALGKAALKSDPVLVNVARDRSFRCPSTGTVVPGRSKSMAATGFFSHGIYGCKKADGSYYTVMTILSSQLGYNTYRGENIAVNTYGVDAAVYRAGCDLAGLNCRGASTTTQRTVAVAERGFMKSSGHRGNILGNFDRFGCASWLNASTNAKYFTCIFSLGGPNALDVTAPSVSAASGAGTSVALGANATFTATLKDNFRLAEGYVKLDSRVVSSWAYSYNVASSNRSVTISTVGLARGAHTIVWAVRDVSSLITYRTITFYVR